MRFVFPEINSVFEFKGDFVNTLVIENRTLFSRVLRDISSSIEGNTGLSVLSKDYVPIPIQKNVELLQDFLNFNISSKALISKIISSLEKVSLNEENYLETQKFMADIEKRISLWAFGFPCDIVLSKVNPDSILKGVGVEIRDNYEGSIGEAEKIIDYMELIREFDREKLFITLNMRSFFEDDVIKSFMQTVIFHDFKVMMIENKAYSLLDEEKRLTVDEDLCEF